MQIWAITGFILFAIVYYCFFKAYANTTRIEINHIRFPELTDNPSVPSLTVLHVSDMHMENISVTPGRLLEMLAGEQLDIIALTGDFLDRTKSIPKLAAYLEVFRKLDPKYGIYAVFGNHDYVLKPQSFSKLRKVLEESGCIVLQNENASLSILGSRLQIIGIDDFSTKKSDFVQAFRGVDDGYRLVLTHDPNVVLDMDDYHFDYLLAGHFHGGQIHWPKPYHLVKMGKLVRMNIVKGLHWYQGKPFYISEGLGQTGLNIRVGSRPEITIHHLPLKTLSKVNELSSKAV